MTSAQGETILTSLRWTQCQSTACFPSLLMVVSARLQPVCTLNPVKGSRSAVGEQEMLGSCADHVCSWQSTLHVMLYGSVLGAHVKSQLSNRRQSHLKHQQFGFAMLVKLAGEICTVSPSLLRQTDPTQACLHFCCEGPAERPGGGAAGHPRRGRGDRSAGWFIGAAAAAVGRARNAAGAALRCSGGRLAAGVGRSAGRGAAGAGVAAARLACGRRTDAAG